MSAEAGFTRKGRLSSRYSVEVTVTSAGMYCEWIPDAPSRLNRKEMRRYREIRDTAIAEMASAMDIGVAVIEIPGGFSPEEKAA